ncbi:MAG: TIM barrel protein [Christensenellales bacterium]|jgi:deoxyribonuclease-4
MPGIRFGPSGNSDAFYQQGYKHTWQAPKWLHGLGLDAFEYSFGHGVRIKTETAKRIGEEAKAYGIAMSAHAPYYVNLAVSAPEEQERNIRHVIEAVSAARDMGATRVVVHPGSASKMGRDEALEKAKAGLLYILGIKREMGFDDVVLCMETMGRLSQLGTVDEVLSLCALDDALLPALDFGHINARGRGSLKTQADYAAVFDAVENALGSDRLKNAHIHYSRIEYSAAGERRHWTLKDTQYGPEFAPLAAELAARRLTPVVICESRGTMAHDAAEMKRMYEAALAEKEGGGD